MDSPEQSGGIAERLQASAVPSANADGSKKTSPSERNAEREALHSDLRKASPAKVMSSSEAAALLSKAPIDGGKITDPANMEPTMEAGHSVRVNAPSIAKQAVADGNFDPFGGGDPQPQLGVKVASEEVAPGPPSACDMDVPMYRGPDVPMVVPLPHVAPPVAHVPSDADKFLDQSKRVTIATGDGTFLVSVIAVKRSADALLLIFPADSNNTTFIPNRGTEMDITYREEGRDTKERVYFPGTYAEVPELKAIMLTVLIITDKES